MLDQEKFFEYVTILAGKLHIFLMHRNKSRFSTFKTESQNSLLSNINDGSDDNETTESLKNPGGNI